MKRFSGVIFGMMMAVGLGLAPLGRGQDTVMQPAAAGPRVVHFVKGEAIEVAKILPAPPAPGSLAARADLEADLQVQAWRTPEQIAWAKTVETFDGFVLFGTEDLIGTRFTKENFPVLVALNKDLTNDLRPAVDAAKELFSRPRPFLVDARVQPCVARPKTGSYPSGHSYSAYLWAAILAEIYPEKRVELFARAERIAWARIIGGVHFPSDLEGGRMLAEACVAELKKSDAFHAAIEKCRQEAAGMAMKKAG
jgi:acid phosphatase (class A)